METFDFQIVTDTAKEARRFMESVEASEVVIEEWTFPTAEAHERAECYGFGITCYSPKQLRRIADSEEVALVYVKNSKQTDREASELCQRLLGSQGSLADVDPHLEEEEPSFTSTIHRDFP
jgi:hypothetical protein